MDRGLSRDDESARVHGGGGAIIAFVIYGAAFTDHARVVFETAHAYTIETFGWFYVITATIILGFVVWIGFSRFGAIRLGGDDARPEFGNITWLMMLLAAGMGIGLVFFGVAEPMQHYSVPVDADSGTQAAIREAMLYSFFHWGLHPWAIYVAIALPLGYFHFRHGLPLAPRSLLYPLIGRRIHGWVGHVVDIVSTVATLFGVGTSLGLGAMQINAGLNILVDLPMALLSQLLIIACITALATVSVVTGVKGGIRLLSQFNVGLGGLLLAFIVLAGPTVYILETFVSSLGYYMQNLPVTSLRMHQGETSRWQADGRCSTGHGGSRGRPSSGYSRRAYPGAERSAS